MTISQKLKSKLLNCVMIKCYTNSSTYSIYNMNVRWLNFLKYLSIHAFCTFLVPHHALSKLQAVAMTFM